MAGVAGWVDFERDVSRERGAVLAMTAALAGRGGAGEGMWAGEHAVLGRRTPVASTLDTGEPLAVAEQGRRPAVVAYDGTLANARALRDRLAADGHRFRGTGDAEVVLRAYLAWGAECAGHLDGMFAFALWDSHTSELLLVRDRLGIKPLSYLPQPSGVLFASEPKGLLAHPLTPSRLDTDGLRAVLTQIRTPGRAVLRDLREVRPGHVVRVRPSGVTTHPYWELRARPHEEDLAGTADRVRDLLTASVGAASAGEPAPGLLLSGGLDSSVLGALAAPAGADGGRLRTFTVGLGGKPGNVPDSPYVEEVVRHLDTRHAEIPADPGLLADPVIRTTALTAKDVPTPYGDKNLTPYLFFRSVAGHVRTALSGEAADTVFAGFAWAGDPGITDAPMFPWVTLARKFGLDQGMGGGLLAPSLRAGLALDTYYADQYDAALAEVDHLPGAAGLERRMREHAYLHLTRWLEPLLLHSERLGTAAGLEIRFPFCDHRLVEYLYNTPWAMKSHDGREKSLLRDVARDLLPASVLSRPKTPFPVTHDRGYKEALRDLLRTQILDDPHAPVAPLLDTAAVRRFAGEPRLLDRGGWLGRTDVEMVLQLNTWLDRYRVRLDL